MIEYKRSSRYERSPLLLPSTLIYLYNQKKWNNFAKFYF
jgi:hypothetical protein